MTDLRCLDRLFDVTLMTLPAMACLPTEGSWARFLAMEERPTLVLPWLLLAAIRKLLCELVSLTVALGICVLLGPARSPCIKFVIVKLASIAPAVYMWLLIFSYYHTLKMTTAFKTFPAVLSSSDRDYGLELAVRRRRTKSLQGEEQLRTKLIASLYTERNPSVDIFNAISSHNFDPFLEKCEDSMEDMKASLDALCPLSGNSNKTMSHVTYEDWFGNEVAIPRDTDRILEQFGVMLLRIAAYLKQEGSDKATLFNSAHTTVNNVNILKCTPVGHDDTDTPPDIGSSKGRIASYVTEYPQIFMKKSSDIFRASASEKELMQVRNTFTNKLETDNDHNNFVSNIDYQTFISYEVMRQSKTNEIDLHKYPLMKQNIMSRDSSDSTLSTTKESDSENENQLKILTNSLHSDEI